VAPARRWPRFAIEICFVRDAATIVLLRAAGDGSEMYLQRRTHSATFMSNAYVFPGGAADEGDASPRHTAVRELYEEAGIRLDPAILQPYAHWMTPTIEPKRFSAVFFLAILPEGQTPQIPKTDNPEVTDSVWLKPEEAGTTSLYLPPPQLRTAFELAGFGRLPPSRLLAAIGKRDPLPAPILPRRHRSAEPLTLLFPWDREYESHGMGQGLPLPADHPQAFGPSRVVRTTTGWKLM
jgi:8-oxo-dGTP pyrophosphatase MutT (NUDIX family)